MDFQNLNSFTPKIRNGFPENIAISKQKIQFLDNTVIKSGDPRLVRQAQKQIAFQNIQTYGLFAPKVHEVTDNSFSMEKINGQSWLDFFNYSSISQIESFFDNIIGYLEFLKANKNYRDCFSNRLIKWKLDRLYENSNYKKFIKSLKKGMGKRGIRLPSSFCHGDLTFSNMIFKGEEVYLIDFLDSFVESYWIDIIKLRQDCFYKWCLIYNDIKSVRAEIILNKLNEKLISHFGAEINNNTFKLLEVINILRMVILWLFRLFWA